MILILLIILINVSIAQQSKSEDYQTSKFLQQNGSISEQNNSFQQNNHIFLEQKEDKHAVFYYHQWSNFIIWGVLVDIGILSNRYGIYSKKRLLIHSIIMGLCVLPSIVAEVLMMMIWNPPQFHGKENLAKLHAPIGFAFLGLIGVQCIGGLLLKISLESKRRQCDVKYQSTFHVYVGYGLYIIGKIQCGIGFYEVYNPTKDQGKFNLMAFWIVYSIVFFWRVILEWLYLNGKLFKYYYQSKDFQCQPETLRDAILIQSVLQNDIQNLKNDFQDQMWFIFNNQIVNLTGFVHPGGQYIWEKMRGRDISRFIYGISDVEDGSCKAYRHSEQAILLLKRHAIGRLSLNNKIIAHNITNDNNKNSIWELSTVRKLSKNVSYFGFKNSSIYLQNDSKNLKSFGQYFQLHSIQNYKIPTRQYTQILSMAPENQAYRKQLVQLLSKTENLEYNLKNLDQQPKQLSELPLLIKNYNRQNGFSQYIHQDKEQQYNIQGPYGPSLPINKNDNILIICGGTGIFPFLDFLDYFLQSLIFQIVSEEQGGEIALKLNPFECDFENKIKITLVLAVENRSEMIGSDIYFPLVSIQKYLQESRFKLVLRIKETDIGNQIDERFNAHYFRKHIGNLQEFEQIFICGPPLMLQQIPNVLIGIGVDQKKLYFV